MRSMITFTAFMMARYHCKKLLLSSVLLLSHISWVIKALEAARHFKHPDMKEIDINGKKVWVDDSGQVITLMLPEDH